MKDRIKRWWLFRIRARHQRTNTSSGVEHSFQVYRYARWQVKLVIWRAG